MKLKVARLMPSVFLVQSSATTWVARAQDRPSLHSTEQVGGAIEELLRVCQTWKGLERKRRESTQLEDTSRELSLQEKILLLSEQDDVDVRSSNFAKDAASRPSSLGFTKVQLDRIKSVALAVAYQSAETYNTILIHLLEAYLEIPDPPEVRDCLAVTIGFLGDEVAKLPPQQIRPDPLWQDVLTATMWVTVVVGLWKARKGVARVVKHYREDLRQNPRALLESLGANGRKALAAATELPGKAMTGLVHLPSKARGAIPALQELVGASSRDVARKNASKYLSHLSERFKNLRWTGKEGIPRQTLQSFRQTIVDHAGWLLASGAITVGGGALASVLTAEERRQILLLPVKFEPADPFGRMQALALWDLEMKLDAFDNALKAEFEPLMKARLDELYFKPNHYLELIRQRELELQSYLRERSHFSDAPPEHLLGNFRIGDLISDIGKDRLRDLVRETGDWSGVTSKTPVERVRLMIRSSERLTRKLDRLKSDLAQLIKRKSQSLRPEEITVNLDQVEGLAILTSSRLSAYKKKIETVSKLPSAVREKIYFELRTELTQAGQKIP